MSLVAAIPYDAFMFGPFHVGEAIHSSLSAVKVHSFGLCVATGLMLAFSLMSRRAEQKLGLSGEDVQNFGMFLVIIGWCFSHVFNVIFYEPQQLIEDPLVLLKVWGSISSFGGLFGGIIAAFIWSYRNPDKDFLTHVELGAWTLVFPWFFGRVGCATVHDHPGAPTDFFLGIAWPDGVVRHDLGFYEALWWFVICVIVWFSDRKPRPQGFYLAIIPILYAPARFSFDFLRESAENGGDIRYFGLTPAQYFSIGLFLVGLYWLRRTWGKEPIVWKEYVYEGMEGATEEQAESASSDSEKSTTTEPTPRPKKKQKKRRK
jgi:phosphatidylglycerol---prolipoprotein diacylglyceryl transferase